MTVILLSNEDSNLLPTEGNKILWSIEDFDNLLSSEDSNVAIYGRLPFSYFTEDSHFAIYWRQYPFSHSKKRSLLSTEDSNFAAHWS